MASSLELCLRMIFIGKPVPTFPDHAAKKPAAAIGAFAGIM
jgi:hypothetical protein